MSDHEPDPRVIPDSETVEEGEEAPDTDNIAKAEKDVRDDFTEAAKKDVRTSHDESAAPMDSAPPSGAESAAGGFSHLDPGKKVPPNLLAKAVAFFQEHPGKFDNPRVISVLDYSLSSRKPRFHVIDLASGQVTSFRMANGKGSEPAHDGIAHSLGNVPGSNKSCLGFVRTAETYIGKHGRSLRLDGLSSTNSNMRSRAIVVHGADYVHDKDVIQGRSNGCPAVPTSQAQGLIDTIKGGSLMLFGLSAG